MYRAIIHIESESKAAVESVAEYAIASGETYKGVTVTCISQEEIEEE